MKIATAIPRRRGGFPPFKFISIPTKATTGAMARTYGYTAFGMPTGRTAGTVQNFTYNFDVQKGNLLSRKDNTRNKTETFGYDHLNRLSSMGGQTLSYAANGNITQMPGVGTLAYGNTSRPYQVTMLTPTGTAVPVREQSVTYTSYQRPNSITENGFNAAFTYNAAGDRVKMQVKQNNNVILSRYYIGKQYELDVENNIERLYLGGDAYSAPAVYVKENGSSWKMYYICRDYLGSITHIANSDGSLKAEYSYDAWGRLRNPATHAAYAPGSEPILFLRRGYTGHEHLYWFGLVNMNARLYDPVLGRFLSPDPYVGNPFMTQHYNRYTYAMNNPLVYIDQDGELANWIIGAIIGVFFYAKAAHDNTPKENQGNPLKWNWLPWNWGKPDEVVFHFGSNTDGSGMHGGISMGKAGQPQFMVGYSSNQGPGMGYHHNGNSNMYHPGYDYNKPEKAAMKAINEAKESWDFSAYGYASLSLMALADDVTGVGVIDDVVIPVAYAAATFKFAYDNQYLIEKQAREIAHWTQKNLSLKNGFVYELRATTSGYYPDVRGGTRYLEKGDVWKYGETTKGQSRYPETYYHYNRVQMFPIYYGNQIEIKIQEKIMIYGYYFEHGYLPAGNKIFR